MEKEQECCPKFIPKKWNGKTFIWKSKTFIKETIPTLFHIPFPPMIGRRIVKMLALAEEAKKVPSNKDELLMLFHDPSAFKSEIFVSVIGKVLSAEANNTNISGTFMAKVFEGGFGSVPKFIKEMDKYLAKKAKKAKDYYIHYAYCPKCAKKYGNNYMILFAKIK